MSIREDVERLEERILSSRASLSNRSRGREYPEEECSIRTAYQRDRDRIIHSKAFRRLKHKTQVFFAPEGDHYRTRLAHTLEVSQIARTIARALRLNEDLTEAIALGHDLGHTPFGHSGEEALNEVYPEGFHHNIQSIRVVEWLERKGDKYPGLNLTFETRDGILNHTGPGVPVTLEGQIVKIADRIAYINHDIDDAIRAGILKPEDLPEEPLKVLGRKHSDRISFMVKDIISNSADSDAIRFSPEAGEAMLALRKFLFDNVYIGSKAKNEDEKAKHVVKELYGIYSANPEILARDSGTDIMDGDVLRHTVDYIAGMTDRYAISRYMGFFVPKAWART